MTRKEEMELNRLYTIVGEKYLGDASGIPENRLHVANTYLEADVAAALKHAEDIEKTRQEIENLLNASPLSNIGDLVHLDRLYNDAIIRRDFANALKDVKSGTELSSPLGYGFSNDDILELAKLHKKNRFRKKIEDLLEDCNFHAECGWLSNGEYYHWDL